MDVDEARAVFQEMRSIPPRAVQGPRLAEALKVIAYHFKHTQNGVSMKGIRGAPDWLGYETSLWKLSEELRQFVKRRRDLRGQNQLLDCFAELAADPSLGKGRQNIVLLLGQYGGADYSDTLEALLSDPEVYGHAIKALVRAKIPRLQTRVSTILESEKTGWIRSAAKKYLDMSF